jgi:hypothetical protein
VIAATVVGAFAAALTVQRGLFEEKHGRVTQRNLDAVKTKWGVAHEQHDLRVTHYVMRKIIEEECVDGSTHERKLAELQPAIGTEESIVVADESIPVVERAGEEKASPKQVVRRTTKLEREPVDQKSVQTADVEISLRSNPRQLGGAVYAGYDDGWRFAYTVKNDADMATQAVLTFPLPGDGNGMFDKLALKVDGEDYLPRARYTNGKLEWRMLMPPQASHQVTIEYQSRGLEYFRYQPGSMREHCAVAVNVSGIDAARLNFPIGSMPPRDELASLAGNNYTLHWDLSRAVTNLDIGVIVPAEQQPGYHIIVLLERAALGLALLGLTLFATRWLIAGRFDLLPIALVIAAYYISVALLANMNDLIPNFTVAMLVSLAPVAIAVIFFWRHIDGANWLWVQSSLLVAIFLIAYPLAGMSENAGAWTHIMYAVVIIYILGLAARHWRKDIAAGLK